MKSLTTITNSVGNDRTIPGLFSVALGEASSGTSDLCKPAPGKNKRNDSLANSKQGNRKPSRKRSGAGAAQRENESVQRRSDLRNSIIQNSPAALKQETFKLYAPHAGSVKLAASFTEWEKLPLNLVKCQDGHWFVMVPLPRGEHAYRFIVDGQWQDDPRAANWKLNPFGSQNAVVFIS